MQHYLSPQLYILRFQCCRPRPPSCRLLDQLPHNYGNYPHGEVIVANNCRVPIDVAISFQ